MSVLAGLIEWVTSVIEAVGYEGIFILMVLESAGVPIPSEAVVTFAGFLSARGKLDFWLVVLDSTAANLVGSIILYYVGYYLGRPFIEKYGKYFFLDITHVEWAEKWFEKYGSITVFIGRVTPAIRTYISLPAGMGKMNMPKFIVYTIAGSLIWNYFLAYVGILLGENWEVIIPYLDTIGIAAVVVALIIFVYYLMIRKKEG